EKISSVRSDDAGILLDHGIDARIRHINPYSALLRGRGADIADTSWSHPSFPPVGPASHPADIAGQAPRLFHQRDSRNHSDIQGASRRGRPAQADDPADRRKARGAPPEAARS